MTYRQSFIVRWSRRDRFAVLVVALTVGFLVGTALLVVAGGAQTANLAAEFDATGTATFVEDPENAPADALVLPVSSVEGPNGEQTLVIGIPEGTNQEFGNRGQKIQHPDGTTLGSIDESTQHRLVGSDGEITAAVTTRDNSIFPDEWYTTTPRVVETLGVEGGLVISAADSSPETDSMVVPLRSALPFFTAGISEVLRLLAILVGASGLLVAVTVYSVTRMSILDRRQAIQVARATGGRPRTILATFTARAGILTATGTVAGYAIGIIVVSSVVNVAVAIGLPTSITTRVTTDVAVVLAPIVIAVPLIGAVAGVAAAWPAAYSPPASIGNRTGRYRDAFSSTILNPRVVVPTTATLIAFAVFALLFIAAAGVLLPTLGGGDTVVTEPGSTHPINSQLPEGYVEGFKSQGINGSGEILLFGVVDDHAIPTRGVVYEDFASVSSAEIDEGDSPTSHDEAVIGTGAAQTLDVEPGDRVPLGGSTRASITRVTVVGTFNAPPPYNDHLLVSLKTARHLSTVNEGNVNIIRGSSQPKPTGNGIIVSSISTDQPVTANESVTVTLRFVNEGINTASKTSNVTFASNQRRHTNVSLEPGEETTKTVVFDGVPSGEYQLKADNETRTVSVNASGSQDTLQLRQVPKAAPPGSTLTVQVSNQSKTPVSNVSIVVGNETVRTDEAGRAKVTFSKVGEYEIRAEKGNSTDTATVLVSDESERVVLTTLSISPTPVDIVVRPTARLVLRNQWNESVTHAIRLEGPNEPTTRTVTLQPGEETVVTRQLERRPSGEYSVIATLDGNRVANQTYRVVGDSRIAAVLATSGQSGESPFARALEMALGNIQVLGATLVVLAALMTIGATTATFADAVHARREALGIRRATGASPLLILRLVLSDALRLGGFAAILGTVIALSILWLLDIAGLLVVFGVRLVPELSIPAVVGVTAAGLLVTILGATVATVAVLQVSPASLLAGRRKSDKSEDFENL